MGDFGLVRTGTSGEKSVAMTSTIVGTTAYMAPEALRGDVSAKMDVFSFGVVGDIKKNSFIFTILPHCL